MQLHELKAPKGANKNRRRVGRGESSGWGKTAGRGHKGQGARTGKGKTFAGFEGGQMPMYRRMPKRGFTNIFAKNWAEVNVDMLQRFFKADDVVSLETLRGVGLAAKKHDGVRILGRYNAHKSGHALHYKLLSALFSNDDAFEIITLEDCDAVKVVAAE